MPEAKHPAEITSAFTVINHDEDKRREGAQPSSRSVNVVRPQPRAPAVPPAPGPAPAPPAVGREMGAQPAARTLLDPKFSRALDFKLRRLKEKEILQANLRRPTRFRPRHNFATSNPNISFQERTSPGKHSQSHPRIDIIPVDEDESKISPKMDKSPSPGWKSRLRKISGSNDGDKPRFITTVKSGQFLLPPPELANLLGLQTLYPPQEREKIVYSYASKPKAVVARQKRSLTDKKEDDSTGAAAKTAPGPGAGGTKGAGGAGRVHAGNVFSGVRALVAGVVGMHRLVEQRDQLGSMGATQYSNVMHDKRVVRGSTFTSHPHAAGDGGESAAARVARTRRRALARRAAAARLRPGTPPPAPGRRHHPIQTEYYLEELFDKGVEMEVGVQTDLFVDRPATPVYVPAKTGADAHTQIYPGDLFDFDLEVQPILEVLVGKTAEQALAEVAQEEELAALREHQRRYTELRDAERAERARLAAQDLRLNEEKERRVAEARVAREAAVEARERAAAAVLVQGYLAELLPAVLAGLRDQGHLLERARRGVDDEFMPWLLREVSAELEALITSRDVLTEIVRDVVEARAELHRAAGERALEHAEPEQSLTPPSEPDPEHEEEEPPEQQ